MRLKRIINNLDYMLLFSVFALILIGITLIGSATHANIPSPTRFNFVIRQTLFAAVNVVLGLYLLRFDYRVLKPLAKPLYIINIVALLGVMFFGRTALGAQRWLQIGPISIQPSEFAKAIMIVSLAAFADKKLNTLDDFKSWLPIFGFVLVPFILVMRQPD